MVLPGHTHYCLVQRPYFRSSVLHVMAFINLDFWSDKVHLFHRYIIGCEFVIDIRGPFGKFLE